jgi:KUP system potassium uptake protein
MHSDLLRQWPALPRILIFISTQVLPVAHIKEEERYHITRKHDAELFYSCVDRRGFRDEAPYGAGAIVEQVMALEAVRNQDSARRQSTLATIHACYAHRCTRVVPCHHVFSKPIHGRGVYGSVRNTVRAFLLEVVYGRMVTLFDNIQNAEK